MEKNNNNSNLNIISHFCDLEIQNKDSIYTIINRKTEEQLNFNFKVVESILPINRKNIESFLYLVPEISTLKVREQRDIDKGTAILIARKIKRMFNISNENDSTCFKDTILSGIRLVA